MKKKENFWIKNLINTFINIPNKCKYCNKGNVNLINNNSIINPLLGKCNNYNEKGTISKNWKDIRSTKQDSIWVSLNIDCILYIFSIVLGLLCSVFYKILELWLINDLNATKMADKFKDIYYLESMNLQYINQNFYNIVEK